MSDFDHDCLGVEGDAIDCLDYHRKELDVWSCSPELQRVEARVVMWWRSEDEEMKKRRDCA